MDRVGLIAGNGNLPISFAKAAKDNDKEIVAINITDQAPADRLGEIVDENYEISVGQLDKIINRLQKSGIKEIVMVGKVNKDLLFTLEFDTRMMKLLNNLEEKNDDAILLALVNELKEAGIEVKEQTTYLETLLPKSGVLNSIKPTKEQLKDMKFGFKMAKGIGNLDIGQTVVVKNSAVIAVEAIEGTDQAILRGGQLTSEGAIVAKVSKPDQDFRFDIPTIGIETIKNLIEIKAQGIVIEAGKTFVVNQAKVCQMANKANISIVAMR
ncbi:LpxI family protein [Selenihalanaerobacter shriftii]|uniref:DUF1009 domain-containing protein n=1 Tax=Selenihalanaerobacter shriftii TaxID=142842 RepID=A0A1T4KYD4_9FIRM|nr:UDP-2,3-diacylglucosamine diphosphatase LpxI [Selenihalanaerobacter shriftii]SJZ47391.1 hypothetical protein SAMN02745118_00941 [Selenihalanaerobacter shriftii]